jgi:hypothetical protein
MSTLRTNTLSNAAGSASVPVDTVIGGSAKAWVNFNGTGTVAIRQAFNVSSITDNGTGNYTLNFTNALADVNYSVITQGSVSFGGVATTAHPSSVSAQATTSCRVRFSSSYEGYLVASLDVFPLDPENTSVAIFR